MLSKIIGIYSSLFFAEYVGYGKQLTRCILGIFVSWLSALVTTLMIAMALNLLGRTMSWFARPVWIFFLYVCPTILVPMIVLLFHSRQLKKVCINQLFDSIVSLLIYFFRNYNLTGKYFKCIMMATN